MENAVREAGRQRHYLEDELEALVRNDPRMWGFIQRGSLDGIWYWNLEDPDDEWMSPEFWTTLGVDPNTKAHTPSEWQDLVEPEDLSVALENFQRHCDDPTHPYDQVVRYRHADGSTVWVRCRGLAIRDARDKPVRMLGAHNDVTRLKRAEEIAVERQAALEAANQKLAAVNEELRSLAYCISHDLKAPVNTGHMLINELASPDNGPLNAAQTELVDYARGSMVRASDLIERVLDYARLIEAEPICETVDLNALTAQILADRADATEAAFATIDTGPMPSIVTDPHQLGLALDALIDNAITYRRPGVPPHVVVKAQDVTGAVRLTVADNGIGIDPAHMSRIFDLFTRLNNRDEYPGSGLGLAICYKAARNLGGTLDVESRKGHGSTFTLTLPKEAVP